ncbi:MAG: hypothetical protein R2941_04490 [Desulfobacterales bacterium]
MKNTSESGKTRWHILLGRLFTELLTPTGVSVLTEFPVMTGSPQADILLLRKKSGKWTREQADILPDGIRDSSAQHILIEFKYTESVTKETFLQILGYETFYRRSRSLAETDVQSFVISARTPESRVLKALGYLPSEKKGVYRNDLWMLAGIPLLCLNELPPEPHNVLVKCFASRKKEKMAAFGALRCLGFGMLRPQVQWFVKGLLRYWISEKGGYMETAELTPEKVMEMGKMWADLILSGLPPEEVLSRYKPEERLRGLGPEEVLSRYKPEERLRGLTEEEIEAYLLKIKKKGTKKRR